MAFNTAEGRAEYTATSGQTLFTFNFKIYQTSDIEVYLTPAGTAPDDTTDILIETADYTVTIDGDNGGTITLTSSATLNDAVTIVRELPNTRSTEYQELGDLYANTLNQDQDYQTYLSADQAARLDRNISIPKSSQNVSTVLPTPEALKLIRWNISADAFENIDQSADLTKWVETPSVTAGQTVITLTHQTKNASLYINGALLNPYADYTTLGNTITLTLPIDSSSDEVVLVGGDIFVDPPSTQVVYVPTIAAMGSVDPLSTTTVIVQEEGRGGTFNYDASQSAVNNGGTIFDGWVREYTGAINVKWFGAKGDGVTDDTSVFTALDSTSFKEVYIPDGTYLSTSQFGDTKFFTLGADTSVLVNGGVWYPKYKLELEDSVKGTKITSAATDPSPVITGSEYPILETAPVNRLSLSNWWGSQFSDVNDNTKGRTGVDVWYANANHYGEGDLYITRTNGTISRHSRHATITAVRGQNNIGMHNGQLNAATDQVTLYGLGDMVLHDQGFDNVALRGQVLILYADGADTYGYDVDRFGYMVWSNGANDIDTGFVPRGKMRIGMDTTGADLSSNGALVLGETQLIYFDGTGADTQSGYGSTDNGLFWIGKPTTGEYLELASNGSKILQLSNYVEYTPAAEGATSFRVKGTSVTTSYIAVGQAGNTSYISAMSDATNNTTLSFRTALSGVESTQMLVRQNGIINITNAPTYADDTAAGTGGLVTGDVYKTATGELRIKL